MYHHIKVLYLYNYPSVITSYSIHYTKLYDSSRPCTPSSAVNASRLPNAVSHAMSAPAGGPERSVAVLPLRALGPEGDAYLGTGLSEDIVAHLTRIV